MRAELLHTTVQGYIDGTYAEIELYDGAFMQVLGRGEDSIDWDGMAGTVEWTNFPPRRPDRVFMPDMTGIIRLDGHERPVMYRLNGISLLPDQQGRRIFSGPVRWYTDDPELLWLNDRWGYEEGGLDLDTVRFHTRAHVIHPESPEAAAAGRLEVSSRERTSRSRPRRTRHTRVCGPPREAH